MDKIFNPFSVAVVGVSDNPRNMARMILLNLKSWKFKGKIYGVHPKGGEKTLGVKIYPSLTDIKGVVDVAVVLSPAKSIPSVIDDAHAKGIKYLCIESAGFSEFSEEGKLLGEEILRKAEEYGIKFVGPNGLGTMNARSGAVFPFSYMHPFKPGCVSIISQSGGVGISVITGLLEHNISANKFVSLGNKYSLDEVDFLEYFIEDETTEIILCYLESMKRGREFMAAAARTDKPILLCKASTTTSGRKQAMSHTGALVNDDQVLDAAMKQGGVVRVGKLDHLYHFTKTFLQPRMKGPRIALASPAGGFTVLASDCAEKHGFTFPALSSETKNAITGELRAGIINVGNPIDLGDAFGTDTLLITMDKTLAQDNVDAFMLLSGRRPANQYKGPFKTMMRNPIPEMEPLVKKYGKPAVAAFVGPPELVKEYRGNSDMPVYDTVDLAIEALASFRDFCTRPKPHAPAAKTAPPSPKTEKLISSMKGRIITGAQAMELLREAKIPVAGFRLAGSEKEALAAAEKLKYPVAMKIDSEDVVHKTEMDAIRLNLETPAQARVALGQLFGIMKKHNFSGSILVQKMAGEGTEVIVGSRNDPHFGPVIMFGLGGIYVEVLKDVAFHLAPLTKTQAHQLVESIRSTALLKGIRGRKKSDMQALSSALVCASRLVAAFPQISEMDINPLIVHPDGMGCTAVDARLKIES